MAPTPIADEQLGDDVHDDDAEEAPLTYAVVDAARHLGNCHPATVVRLCDRGELEYLKIGEGRGGRRLILADSLRAYIERHKQTGPERRVA
jgi:hypothetical protein